MMLTGAEIANSSGSKFSQDVTCPWCCTASRLDLGPQHVQGDMTIHCRKCGKFSRHKTADKWFDQHQERNEELKDIWKKIPSDSYVSCRQGTRGTPWIYTVSLGGDRRAEEFMSRDIVADILTNEYGMSYNQANRALLSAALTPGQRIYLQRHTRLVMAAEQRDEMKRTGEKEQVIATGSTIRVNGVEGLFLRYSANDGFAVVALPAPGIDGFGDAEVPVMDLEVVDAGGPEVAEDFEFDKEMDGEMGLEEAGGGLEQALEHIEQAEEIVEDLVLEEGGAPADAGEAEEGDFPGAKHQEHEEQEEKEEGEEGEKDEKDEKPPFAARRRAGAPRRCPQCGEDIKEGYKHRKNYSQSTGYGDCQNVKDSTANYKTKDDLAAMERPKHKTEGPKLTDTKLKGKSWVPRNEGKNPKPKDDKNLTKEANVQAQRRVHTHYTHSGDLRRAIEVNRDDLSIEDIRVLCKFYANTGKIAHHEADDLAFWFIGSKPRLLCASDITADRDERKHFTPHEPATDPRERDNDSWKSQNPPEYDDDDRDDADDDDDDDSERGYGHHRDRENWGYDGALSMHDRRITAKDAGEVEVPDAHPESGLSSGSGATDTPDPKRQAPPSANSITGPEKVKEHGTGEQSPGDVKVPDLGVPKGAFRRRADGICQKCGTPLNQAAQCPTCNASAGQQAAQGGAPVPMTALSINDLDKRKGAAHKPGCGCGFCSRVKENQDWSKSRKNPTALAAGDMKKVAHDGVGIFIPALYRGREVLVIAVDNTSLRATIQNGDNNQSQVDFADLEPVKTGPYSGMAKKPDPGAK